MYIFLAGFEKMQVFFPEEKKTAINCMPLSLKCSAWKIESVCVVQIVAPESSLLFLANDIYRWRVFLVSYFLAWLSSHKMLSALRFLSGVLSTAACVCVICNMHGYMPFAKYSLQK